MMRGLGVIVGLACFVGVTARGEDHPTTAAVLREITELDDPSWRQGPRADDGRGDRITRLDTGEVVVFSRDGARLVTGHKGWCQLWDVGTFAPVGAVLDHGEGLFKAEFDAAGDRVLTVAARSFKGGIDEGEAKLWDAKTGKLLLGPIHHKGERFTTASLRPDGKVIATSWVGNDKVRLWDAETGKMIGELPHEKEVWSVQFDPMGESIITTGDQVTTVWDARTLKIRGTMGGNISEWNQPPTFSADGKRMAINLWKWMEVYELPSCRKIGSNEKDFLHLDDYLTSASISPDGSRVATSADVGGAAWDAVSGEKLLEADALAQLGAKFSPDGRVVLMDTYQDPPVWEVGTKKPYHLPPYRGWNLRAAAFSPDGRWVAVSTYRGDVGMFRVPGSAGRK